MKLLGFHHLTAITANAPGNLAFYTRALGMRLVKKTVNQDDPSAYHLFYADGRGSPGSDVTFFDWAAPRERRGTRSIVRTGLRVAEADGVRFWADRLDELGLARGPIVERDGRTSLDFDDPEGQRLRWIADDPPADPHPWLASPAPAGRQAIGLGAITLSVPELAPTDALLTGVMGMRPVRAYDDAASDGSGSSSRVHVYQMDASGPAGELHIAVEPGLPPARPGAGGVHHVAFRVGSIREYQVWIERLRQHRVASSGPVDRYYFHSVYFREPSGILFELATDEPGFSADEPADRLGERLSLPPFLEPNRARIEAGLKPL